MPVNKHSVSYAVLIKLSREAQVFHVLLRITLEIIAHLFNLLLEFVCAFQGSFPHHNSPELVIFFVLFTRFQQFFKL